MELSQQELTKMDEEELLRHRHRKFRSIGGFQEGIPIEPEKKRNMKPSEVNSSDISDIESEVQALKKEIVDSNGPISDPMSKESIQNLVKEVEQEMTKAFISMGLEEEIQSVKMELSKTSNQPLSDNLKDKVDKIIEEVKTKMSQPGAYIGLKQKLQKLDRVNMIIEMKVKQEKLKQELNEKISGETKAKIASIKEAQEKISNGDETSLDHKELVEKALEVDKELRDVLKSSNLEIVGVMKRSVASPPQDVKQKIVELNNEIIGEIDRVVSEKGLKGKIKELEDMIAKGSDPEELEKMEQSIKESIFAALDVTALKEKIERVKEEVESSSKVGVENGRY